MQGETAAMVAGNPFQPITPFVSSLNYPPIYSKYGIGLSLLGIPFYLLGNWLSGLLPFMYSQQNGAFGLAVYSLLLTEVVVTVVGVGLYYWLLRLLDFGPRAAVITAGLFGVATMAWHYSRTFLSEPLVTAGLIMALIGHVKYSKVGAWQWAGLSGFVLGFTIATRLTNLALAPIFGIYLLWAWWQNQSRPRQLFNRAVLKRLVLDVLAWLAGIGFWLGLVGWYNYARFGSIAATGYEEGFINPFWTGFYGLVFSSGKGIFFYNPVLLLGLIGSCWAFKHHKAFIGLSLAIGAVYLVSFSLWYDWGGGGVWGPRFLLPLVPVLLWPAAYLFSWLDNRRPARRNWPKVLVFGLWSLIALIIAASLVVQWLSINVDFHVYLAQIGSDKELQDKSLYNISDSPILAHWRLWNENARADMAPYFYFETPFARWVRFVKEAGSLAAWILALAGLGFWLRPRKTLKPVPTAGNQRL